MEHHCALSHGNKNALVAADQEAPPLGVRRLFFAGFGEKTKRIIDIFRKLCYNVVVFF